MSLPGSPSLLPAGSGAPAPATLYRSAPAEASGTSSPAHGNPHSLSPRLSGTMLGGFLPAQGGALVGLGNGAAGPLVSALGSLTSGAPALTQSSSGECKLVEVHGVKVASFSVHGQEELICLPQVFDLFLKHLVGGLHTVYTKLKRLDITPVVCTVEQVRVLRGLGAIQPGVNRCKLISRKDFETLYQDCTSASSRPGRPPKRCSSGAGIQESPRLLHPGLPGLLSPNLLSHTGLTAAAMAELQKLQKMKMMMSLQNGNESDNDDLHSNAGGSECSWDKERLSSPLAGAHCGGPGGGGGATTPAGTAGGGGRGPTLGAVNQQQLQQQQQQLLANRLDLPFMMMPHPLLPMGLPPASVAMAMSQMNHLSTIANMAAAAQQIHVHRAPVIKERVCDSPSLSPSVDDTNTPLQSQPSSSASSSPERPGLLSVDADVALANPATPIKKITKDKEEEPSLGQALPPGFPAPFLFADSLSSVETLLTNIQGLLKVAVDNARVQDKQIQAEKRELKMELYREREMRESLERQLTSELQSRASIQKRLKKEKKAKRKLQEALEFESKRRERGEDTLKHSSSSSPEPLHAANNAADAAAQQQDEINGSQQDDGDMQESRAFLKTTIMF
ncbi:dachshund b [Dunckerocampus dactyliophorus]|uniref:dachshund b n=1 Tax=Dunckerocampus dactyliophorus TaxID=161453 RepID=UPI002404A8FB|nr:dachshund b [Dunckerocampus dactyliophorus]XP_054656724.1 dachshund b [Dunckerocampus dactyliophorus]XP_054656725.1 dachshund b [Dunckerocampus dactyliophorus]XP_054656726.1 dachshund b [Dunckerocampus dactyliophorus]